MSRMTQCHAEAPHTGVSFPWRDAAIVVGATLLSAIVFVRIDLSESLFAFTRDWEHLQIDELPITLLVLAIGLGWFAWRRYTEMRRELAARAAAEARLAALLEDHRRLTHRYVHLQESERKALARELHDELGQYLYAIKTDAVAIQRKADRSELAVHQSASAIVAHCDHVQECVRALIGRLRPIGLDVLGLRAALEHFFQMVRASTPQRALNVRLEGDLDDLDDATSLAVYRLIQEGLTNVSRHAGARSVEVEVARAADDTDAKDEIAVRIVDDGHGADPHAKTLGLGLLGMRERVEMLGGTFETRTALGQGFAIYARIPVTGRTRRQHVEQTVCEPDARPIASIN